ncbi:MAG TPA: tyrosine-type recombinase/integrase [Bryobacteraceae bacterium]
MIDDVSLVPAVAGGTDDLARLKALVLDSVPSPNSRRAYEKALDDFLAWYRQAARGPFRKAVVQEYRAKLEADGLAAATINVRLAAIRKLAREAADNLLLAPELAAGISRVRGAKALGVRAGNWLAKEQAEQLIAAPNPATLQGKRDRVILALLLGCGLRRHEVAGLTFEEVQQRDGRWAIVDLKGKGGRVRTVPMPGWARVAIENWGAATGLSSGRILHSINKGDHRIHAGMSPQSVFMTVQSYARQLGIRAAPHDLRRTFAKLAHKGRAPLEQIQLSLGHATILTTERYLGVRQDLNDAPCDHLGLDV